MTHFKWVTPGHRGDPLPSSVFSSPWLESRVMTPLSTDTAVASGHLSVTWAAPNSSLFLTQRRLAHFRAHSHVHVALGTDFDCIVSGSSASGGSSHHPPSSSEPGPKFTAAPEERKWISLRCVCKNSHFSLEFELNASLYLLLNHLCASVLRYLWKTPIKTFK